VSESEVKFLEDRRLSGKATVAFLWLVGHHFQPYWHIWAHRTTTSKLLTVQKISDGMEFRKYGTRNFKTAAINHSATPPSGLGAGDYTL